jgi:hypothetical protein
MIFLNPPPLVVGLVCRGNYLGRIWGHVHRVLGVESLWGSDLRPFIRVGFMGSGVMKGSSP